MRFLTRLVIGLLLLSGASAAPALAKTYSADRFDSRIRLMPQGALEVTETVVFRFEDGTFDHVFREISTRRTDGLEIIRAAMDGRVLPFGNGVNQVEVTGRSKLRVEWRFHPAANSTHTFVLTYLARGVLFQEGQSDVLSWRALPSEHDYKIASASVEFELAALSGEALPNVGEPVMEWHRIEGPVAAGVIRAPESDPARPVVARATAERIRANGWFEARWQLPRGSLIAAAPGWQTEQAQQAALAPRWLFAAAVVFCCGVIALVALRLGYATPTRDVATSYTSTTPPSSLAPGLVGPLLSNGRVSLEHAMATLFSLADRRVVSIAEHPRGFLGQRSFDVQRRVTTTPLAGHESTLLLLGAGDDRADAPIPLHSLRRRVVRRFRAFSRAVQADLLAAGLLDMDRKRARDRYVAFTVGTMVLAGLGCVAAGAFTPRYGGWPFVLPAAVALVALVATIFSLATTPLSDEGLRQAAQWRGFRAYLKSVTQHHQQTPAHSLEALLPLAITAGLASHWARYLKHHPGSVPPWFRALSAEGQNHAFTAFITSGGSGAHGGAGAGAGAGAAGGGASGAG